MYRTTTDIIVQLSQSHQQMARILEAKRQVVVRMAELINGLPDAPQLNGMNGLLESTSDVTKNLISYLNSLADLEESVADSLTNVAAALREADEE